MIYRRVEPELISEVAREGGVREDTVKRELKRLLNKKAIEKGLFSDGNLRAVVYTLPRPKKAERKARSEQDHEQRTLRELSKD